MTQQPEPVPATGDAYAGGYFWTIDGGPLYRSTLSADQFSGNAPWETADRKPVGSNTETGSSL